MLSSASYSWDTDGNRNAFGELTQVTAPDGTVDYTRDALGRVATRTRRRSNNRFAYDGGSITLVPAHAEARCALCAGTTST